jgi:hypothetical protein
MELATKTRAEVESEKHPVFPKSPTDGTTVGEGRDEVEDEEEAPVAVDEVEAGEA